MSHAKTNTLIYVLRRDLRVSDNPILHHLATSSDHGFTHLLPVYVFPAQQIEVSGFIRDGGKSPYPEAKSRVGGYWRCGPHRARFIGEAVGDVKRSLASLGSGLVVRVGMPADVVGDLVEGLLEKQHGVGAVWMTDHEGFEEKQDEKAVASVCEKHGVGFKLWLDEKYFIDDRDLSFENPQGLPAVFTIYRKSAEPLRERPRAVLPTPPKGSLPPFPDASVIPAQSAPFSIPERPKDVVEALVKPVKNFLPTHPGFPKGAVSAHPFRGGEAAGQKRLKHLVGSEGMKDYKDTRNGLIGTEFSTKLSAYLAQGCITARQIHHALVGYEDGTDSRFAKAAGFGAGENEGTGAIRFELLWRDYMRLHNRKFGNRLFRLEGIWKARDCKDYEEKRPGWKSPARERALPDQDPDPNTVARIIERFVAGTTGMGLIDASQRELMHTGYTSNRARQNVASFLAKHLGIDWRYGAEWYEMLLVDYDVSSNWANWQYVSGVGNDPRGEMRIFNPVKQAFDYDRDGSYVRSWVPEVRKLERLECVFQACTASEKELKAAGLEGNIMVTDPVKRIQFTVDGTPLRSLRRAFFRKRGIMLNAAAAARLKATSTPAPGGQGHDSDSSSGNTIADGGTSTSGNGSGDGNGNGHPEVIVPRFPRSLREIGLPGKVSASAPASIHGDGHINRTPPRAPAAHQRSGEPAVRRSNPRGGRGGGGGSNVVWVRRDQLQQLSQTASQQSQQQRHQRGGHGSGSWRGGGRLSRGRRNAPPVSDGGGQGGHQGRLHMSPSPRPATIQSDA
ncbi:cryptochrome [Diplogelasinospora grovesii]|uniref:Cryptochrome DASH n=1 Tax=Diplogelasinospora grovesii TaxID=303347 RepID=A0AAN6S5C1_9PEZI|nr:cryptochrome [Diplogelasinospora grovesii]